MSIQKRELTVGEKLKILRKYHGITQEELASSLYFSIPTISRCETDTGNITLHMLEMLCDYYGVTLKDFFDSDFWGALIAVQELKRIIKK